MTSCETQVRHVGNAGRTLSRSPDKNSRRESTLCTSSKKILGRIASATDVPCKAQVEALLAQVSTESSKDVPIGTQVAQASQKCTRLRRDSRRPLRPVKMLSACSVTPRRTPSVLRVNLKMLSGNLKASFPRGRQLSTARTAHRALTSRSFWKPDAASWIILDDIWTHWRKK